MQETTLGANKWLNDSKRLDFPTGEDLTNVIQRDVEKSLEKSAFDDHNVVMWLEGHERYQENLRGKNDVEKHYYEYIIGESQEIPINSEFTISLDPMQIRTFVIQIEKN